METGCTTAINVFVLVFVLVRPGGGTADELSIAEMGGDRQTDKQTRSLCAYVVGVLERKHETRQRPASRLAVCLHLTTKESERERGAKAAPATTAKATSASTVTEPLTATVTATHTHWLSTRDMDTSPRSALT